MIYAKREVLKNCRIEADQDGSSPALIQDINSFIESVSVNLKKKWKNGDKVRVTIELVERGK